jgi:hypothetical protein
MGHSKIVLLQVVVAGVTSLVNSVQTNGSVSVPLHKRDLDLQARGTHRKSDSVRNLYMTLDLLPLFLAVGAFKFHPYSGRHVKNVSEKCRQDTFSLLYECK